MSNKLAVVETPKIQSLPWAQEGFVDARVIHKFLRVKSEFRNWIKNRIEDFKLKEGNDFQVVKIVGVNAIGGSTTTTEYHVTQGIAAELCMVEHNEMGKRTRKYFIACEKSLQRRLMEQAALRQLTPTQQIRAEAERLLNLERAAQ